MYRRNFLHSGDYVVLVPLGAMLTLCYNMDGILDGVTVDGEFIDNSREFMQTAKKYKTFPFNIHVTNGRTEVRGVLYTSNIKNCLGELPKYLNNIYINDYIENGQSYNFFAITFETDAASYKGYTATAMNERLRMFGFHTIPGFIMPSEIADMESTMQRYLYNDNQFTPGIVSYYLVSNSSSSYDYIPAKLHGYSVGYGNSSVVGGRVVPNMEPTETGQFISHIEVEDNGHTTVKQYGYNTIIKWNLHRSSYVILNDMNEIVYSSSSYDNDKLYDSIICPFCKKPIDVSRENIMCSNRRCVSRMYPNIKHTLSRLNLKSMSYEEYLDTFKGYSNLLVSDILDLEQYQNNVINITISELLDAIIPVSDVRNRSVFKIFVNNCANNIETVRYYIANPGEILSDIRELANSSSGNELADWFRDPVNVDVFNTFINSPVIHLSMKNREYEGAPILRGESICITGRFKHGDYDKISRLFASYSANTTSSLDDKTSIVVTGDIKEDVSGVIIHDARERNIPVVSESKFFSEYEIDQDISNNLQ